MPQIYNLHLTKVRVATSRKLLEKFTKHPTPVVETDWERFFSRWKFFPSLDITDMRTPRRWESYQNTTFVGPGHPCVVGDWLVYHAWLFDHVAADQVVQSTAFEVDNSLKTGSPRKTASDRSALVDIQRVRHPVAKGGRWKTLGYSTTCT